MKERPILFSGSMVRAILEGRKTQTRRIVKPPKDENAGSVYEPCLFPDDEGREITGAIGTNHGGGNYGVPFACPFGQPGDRLWVRETFRIDRMMFGKGGIWVEFKDGCIKTVDAIECPNDGGLHMGFETWQGPEEWKRWKPSIHMPRWASRITLEVTAVRVERLHDIREDDAHAEGCPADTHYGEIETPKCSDWFRLLWQSISGADSWTANPWVWVVEFKRVTP